MTKNAPRVRHNNLYTVRENGIPVAQAIAISRAEAVALWEASKQRPVMEAILSTPLEARTLAGLPLLSRDAPAVSPTSCASAPDLQPERDPRVRDMFDDAPAADHVGDAAEMVEPLAAGGFAPCGRALGDCGRATQTCGRDGCGVELAPIAAGLPAEFLSYIEGEEPAAEQPGEPADCLDAAPTACVSAGASSAVDDDGGRELTAAERAAYEEQGAARFERHHGSELKRQAEAHAARSGGKIVAKYRDPATGQTWSGRGLKPRWLAAAIEEGRTLDEFLIENQQGAQA